MSFAPQQNWDEYYSLVDPIRIEKDRLLKPTQKLRQYQEIFDSVWSLRAVNANKFINPCEDAKLICRAELLEAYNRVSGPSCD